MQEARPFTTFLLLPLLLLLLYISTTASASASSSTAASSNNYIKTSCTKATYPDLCYRSLSPYATTIKSNPWKLCASALTVSLNSAHKAKSAFSSLSKSKSLTKAEKVAVKQCRDTIADSIDQLKQSVNIMSGIIRAQSSSSSSSSYSSSDMELQMSNVKTYVSGAITDDSTCTDGLEEEKVRASLKKKILKWEGTVESLASNALSLVNTLKY